jgi:DNA-directed RNA polymerase specialized sigma24 family protein
MAALRLHDVEDGAAFVSSIVQRSGVVLGYHDREDLEQHLLVFAWTLAEKYDPDRGTFSNYLFRCASLQVREWQRGKHGRTVWKFKNRIHVRKLPEFVSYDAERDSLGEAFGTIGGDPETVRDEAGGGLYEARDRERVRDLDRLGIQQTS